MKRKNKIVLAETLAALTKNMQPHVKETWKVGLEGCTTVEEALVLIRDCARSLTCR